MMSSEDFKLSLNPNDVEKRFIEKLKELSEEFIDLCAHLDTKIISLPVISDLMIKIRSFNTIDRKKYYLEYRIKDQEAWCASKAESNQSWYNIWFGIIILSQVSALICATYLISNPNIHCGLYTTLSSCAISWLQLIQKQHQELKQVYTTAAQELTFILALSDRINTEQELSDFVLDS